MVGFGLVYGGVNAVFWSSLARVSSSWVISPLMGAAVSFLVYKCIRRVSTILTLLATCYMEQRYLVKIYSQTS
jgi:phosphate/sulfate permease